MSTNQIAPLAVSFDGQSFTGSSSASLRAKTICTEEALKTKLCASARAEGDDLVLTLQLISLGFVVHQEEFRINTARSFTWKPLSDSDRFIVAITTSDLKETPDGFSIKVSGSLKVSALGNTVEVTLSGTFAVAFGGNRRSALASSGRPAMPSTAEMEEMLDQAYRNMA